LPAAVAVLARYLTVNAIRIGFTVDERFFPWLQRSHRTASTLAFVFADNLLDGIGRPDEFVLVDVAEEALIGGEGRGV